MSAKPKTQVPETADPRGRPRLASSARSGSEFVDATFDRLIYERVRLGIMSALAVRDEITFSELK